FSSYWVYRKRNGDDFGKEPRCKVDAFDNISARVASLQSLKLDVFALQGLKPAADLRCHVLLEARGVYNRLFDDDWEGTRFVSGASVSKIILKLEEIAKVVIFTVRKKDCWVRLEGSRQGDKE
ncbi:unnamed protein product, partial [Brassica oleracea]